jgi:hypothetical protein
MRLLLPMLACFALLTVPPDVRAGLYHPDVLGAFDIDDDGNAVHLSPDTFLIVLGNVKETDWKRGNFSRPDPPERYLELKRAIEDRRMKGLERLSEEEKLAFCADLLRFRGDAGAISEALRILNGLAGSRPRDNGFVIYTHFAYALRLQQGQRDSLERARLALEYPFPAKLAGLTPKQLAWYLKLEKDFHLPFLSHRARLGEGAKSPPELDPLFRDKTTRESVRYIGESGQFEPGAIAAAEKVKLPPDAVAIVQQLVLWYPSDERLLWQLAELYNANGEIRAADQLFDQVIRDLHIESQEARDHRTIVKERVEWIRAEMQRMLDEKKSAELEKKRKAEEEKRQRYVLVGVIVALVLTGLFYYQTRELRRRFWNWKKRVPDKAAPLD